MDILNILTVIAGLSYIGFTMYRANREIVIGEYDGLLRWLLYGAAILAFLYSLFVFQVAFIDISAVDPQLPQIDRTAALISLVVTGLFSLFSAQIVSSAALRQRIRRLLPSNVTYDPESPVHITAAVLILALLSLTIGQFVLGGGIAGLAESIAAGGISFGDVLFDQTLWIIAATLGIGLFVRRTPQQALERLGLRLPKSQDLTWGTAVGVLLFGIIIAFSLIWASIVSPQELQEQTAAAEQVAQSFESLPLAFLTSLVVAIGEEVFFRGAVQPVFGIWVTSLFFTVLHTQYTLTPATLIIFITSLALGWLRNRQSTSAAITGHFVYNFIQLALAGASV